MKWTALADGVNLASGVVYAPGDQLDWKENNCRPLIDAGAAVEGHVEVTEKAARLCREHDIDPREVDGTGKDGRVLAADVEYEIEDEPAEEE